jgi:putative DNA methylase
MKHRLIGETFPIEDIGEASSREKSLRSGNISTLHIWWARRPLASSRASIYAALVDPPKNIEEWGTKREFISKLSKWESAKNFEILEKAKNDILESNSGKIPKILDPFGGGGAIPLESVRLGCETFSCDYNPVATILQKCTFEFPQKFSNLENPSNQLFSKDGTYSLVDDVKKLGELMIKEIKKELDFCFPADSDTSIVGYLWARTISCSNPSCKAEIPLMRQYILSKKLTMVPIISSNTVQFEIFDIDSKSLPKNFNPQEGTISKAIATCLVCKTRIPGKSIRKIFSDGKSKQKMIACVYLTKNERGKKFRAIQKKDLEAYESSKKTLEKKRIELSKKFNIDPIPDEDLVRTGGNQMAVLHYGMNKFGDLFNIRQQLVLISISEKIHDAYNKMITDGVDQEYAKAVVTYLALALDRLTDYNSRLSFWVPSGEFIAHTFGRQALQMTWDYFELCPWSGSTGDLNSALKWITKVIEHCSDLPPVPVHISNSSATHLDFADNFFDAVITDPPYYDNVYYSNLADFFYVWLKRSIGFLYPNLFTLPLTPKSDEIVQDPIRHKNKLDSKLFFESRLKKSFEEIHRVLKPDGITVIVYAHKSTDGWETMLNSLLSSGLVITGSWPIHTERKGRLTSNESAALSSSIYMIARKWKKEELGFYREIKKSLEKYISKKLEYLWDQGISGADFFISAIGASVEIFGKYEKIIDDNDNQIMVSDLLEDVRKIVTDFAIHQVLHDDFSVKISQMSRLYILCRWAYGHTKIPFDDALKMTQSVGIDIRSEWNKGFIKKDKEFIIILEPTERKLESLDSHELIDVLHQLVMLWKGNKRKEMVKTLKESEFGNSDVLFKVAQAISESNPESSESKLLDGFLASKSKIMESFEVKNDQTKLL